MTTVNASDSTDVDINVIDNLSRALPLDEYLKLFDDHSTYHKRLLTEVAEGKSCFVAANCPTCSYQLQTDLVNERTSKQNRFKFCTCGTEIPSAAITAALAPVYWEVAQRTTKITGDPRW